MLCLSTLAKGLVVRDTGKSGLDRSIQNLVGMLCRILIGLARRSGAWHDRAVGIFGLLLAHISGPSPRFHRPLWPPARRAMIASAAFWRSIATRCRGLRLLRRSTQFRPSFRPADGPAEDAQNRDNPLFCNGE
jgi:hypothetical protein